MNRVMIVDDHRMFAQSLARLFGMEEDFEVVGTAYSAAEALDTISDARPDLCVLDYQLPDGDGTTLAGQLRTMAPDVRILLLTGVNRPAGAQEAMAAGCDAFITKDRAANELVQTMRSIVSGEHLITGDVAAAMKQRNGAIDAFNLTTREVEILQALGSGASTAGVAEQMHISLNTVRTHVQRVIKKLGAHSKLEAVAIGRSQGLL